MALHLSRYLIKLRLLPVCHIFLRLYLSLLRLEILGEEPAYERFKKHGRIIVPVWHQRLLPALAYVTRFKDFNPIVMISRSRDGELIADMAHRLGLVPVRGSSSRGGAEAFMTLVKELERNPAVIHIVDGPRGPKSVVKPGLIRMAHLSGAAIFPVTISTDRAWVAGSWDRFLVPKPFSKVTIQWEELFFVPTDADPEALEDLRKNIEIRLIKSYAKADLKAGWEAPL